MVCGIPELLFLGEQSLHYHNASDLIYVYQLNSRPAKRLNVVIESSWSADLTFVLDDISARSLYNYSYLKIPDSRVDGSVINSSLSAGL